MRGWLAVAGSDEVGAGRLRAGCADGVELVLYRGADSIAHAADYRCPRRGFPLVHGTVEPSGIRSLIGGWLWSPDGSSTGPDGVVHRGEETLTLRHYPTLESAGLLLVRLDGAGPSELPALPGTEVAGEPVLTRAVTGHPLTALESLADPHTLGFLLGTAVTGEPEVCSNGAEFLHLRFALDPPGDGRTVDVRAFGPQILSVAEKGAGGALIAVTPTAADGPLELRAATWGGAEWPALVDRAAELIGSVRRTAERVGVGAGSGLSAVRTWTGQG